MIRSLGKLLPSVSASPPLSASAAGECSVCDSNAIIPSHRLSNSASVSLKALDFNDPTVSQALCKDYKDDDDWEFAGDEEREDEGNIETSARYLTGDIAPPYLLQMSLPFPGEAPLSLSVDSDKSNVDPSLEIRREIFGCPDEEMGQSSACDWLEPPPISGALGMESERQTGSEGVMLEAFQQFQQNPQVQEMVVALASDESLWRAVLANKKIQELRFGNAEGDFEVGITQDCNFVAAHSREMSSFILLSRNAVREFRNQIRGIIDVVGKKLQGETHQFMHEVMMRAFIIMIVFMLCLIAFLCLLPLQASLE